MVLSTKRAGRHQRAGVAGADAGIRFARLHQVDRDAHRRVFLLAQRVLRLLVHGDDLRRFADDDAIAAARGAVAQQRWMRIAQADQHDAQVGLALQSVERRGHGDRGAVIAPHGVDRDGDRPAAAKRCGRRMPHGAHGSRRTYSASGLSRRLDDFLAAIEAVRRDAMTRVRLARSRVDRQRRAAQAVVRAVHAALGRGLSALLNWHDYSLSRLLRVSSLRASALAQHVPQILKRSSARRLRSSPARPRGELRPSRAILGSCIGTSGNASNACSSVSQRRSVATDRRRPARSRRARPARSSSTTTTWKRSSNGDVDRLHAALAGQHTRAAQLALDRPVARRMREPKLASIVEPALATRFAQPRQIRGAKSCARSCSPPVRRHSASTISIDAGTPGVAAWGAYTSGDPAGCQKNKGC